MFVQQWWWLGQTTYVFTCVVAKISIALALLRLTVAKAHTILLWTVIALSTAVGLVFWFVLTLQCHPVDYFWRRVEPKVFGTGKCLDVDILIDIAYLYSVIATVCDFILGLLPIALVWNLQMTPKTKAALAGILNATAEISIWSNVEAGLGITAGSLVTLRPLFRWFRGTTYGGTHSIKPTAGSMPLSSMNGTHPSRQDPSATKFWRPDLDPEDSRGVITTIQTSRTSRNSSQEDLYPRQASLPGVNVHKSFLVTSDEM
ncbi:hypothetical protein ATERTT37_005384 [Aspergillus terreus]